MSGVYDRVNDDSDGGERVATTTNANSVRSGVMVNGASSPPVTIQIHGAHATVTMNVLMGSRGAEHAPQQSQQSSKI